MVFSASRTPAIASRSASAWRPNLGNGARRDVRRAHEIAQAHDVYAFKLHGVTWITRKTRVEVKPQETQDRGKPANAPDPSAMPARKRRSRERQQVHAAHRKMACDHRVRSLFFQWRQEATSLAAEHLQDPPQMPAVGSAITATAADAASPPPERQPPHSPLPTERERAQKRAPSTPTAADSPVEPRSKTRLMMLPSPPPSIPPSPPASTSSSPPSNSPQPPSITPPSPPIPPSLPSPPSPPPPPGSPRKASSSEAPPTNGASSPDRSKQSTRKQRRPTHCHICGKHEAYSGFFEAGFERARCRSCHHEEYPYDSDCRPSDSEGFDSDSD